ncbi:expressed unknown protein [Seminavis robusta]|uniref:Uncharacterized protein n=1 Tax=Seminavis robusta TaxID=568900 RepID=A0A9N8H9A9_9STRA|nr:expressed unknown protein [Seminavis robusta]|eukprot:Sro185_g080320.1 n/a (845) ;mRNA; f:41622-44156
MSTTRNGAGLDCPIAAILQSFADDGKSKVHHMDVLLGTATSSFTLTRAFYLNSNNVVKFRHEGERDRTPPVLYLGDMKDDDKTLVYYSSSGSGKTSDLVGSSASRDSDLAVILGVSDPEPRMHEQFQMQADQNIDEDDESDDESEDSELETKSDDESDANAPKSSKDSELETKKKKNRSQGIYNPEMLDGSQPQGLSKAAVLRPRSVNAQAADWAIRRALEKALKKQKEKLLFKELAKASNSAGRQVKLVLAVDEASSCPRVIRGMLRFPKPIKGSVKEFLNMELGLDEKLFDIKISIAGTGVASSTIGSVPKNFRVLKPYHEDHFEDIINHKLQHEPLVLEVPWRPQQEKICDLKTIRSELPVLASLVVNGRLASITLAQLRKCATSKEEVKEGVLASRIVSKFLDSNGLMEIAQDEERKPIVAASALAVHFFADRDEFKLSVPDDSQEVAKFAMNMDFFPLSTGVLVKDMVSTYGLLEPACPVERRHRGQSIAPPLKMSTPQQLVAIFMMGLDLESMLEPTWFGFELMSTHFIKCAIAASAAVHPNKRPSVHDALRCLGFKSNKGTSSTVKGVWEELSKWEAVFSNSDIKSPYYTRTRQLQVGLKIVESSNYGELLQLEEKLEDAIRSTNAPCDSSGKVPPIAFINEGNSPLFDGGVTFLAVDRESKEIGELGDVCTMSILNQAKDFHGDSKIDATKLNEHAERVGKPLLDWVFGQKRLLCVSSTSSSLLVASGTAKDRDYLPYDFTRSKLLAPLLRSLKDQRWLKTRTEKYTRLYDAGGEKRADAQLIRKKHAGTVEPRDAQPIRQKRERDDAGGLELRIQDPQRKKKARQLLSRMAPHLI